MLIGGPLGSPDFGVEELFRVGDDSRFHRDHAKPDGYTACHRVVTLRDEMAAADPVANLAGVVCEIQVVTVHRHIWNELEHDIKYKTPTGAPTTEQKSLLGTLHDQLSLVGQTVERLMDATERQKAESLAPIESADDLRAALAKIVGRSLSGNFARLLDLLAGALPDLTRAELERFDLSDRVLAVAEHRLLEVLRVPRRDVDDVNAVVAALWNRLGEEFSRIIGSWPGKPGSVSRTVRALSDGARDGKL